MAVRQTPIIKVSIAKIALYYGASA